MRKVLLALLSVGLCAGQTCTLPSSNNGQDNTLEKIPAGTYSGELTVTVSQSTNGGDPQSATSTQTSNYIINADGYLVVPNDHPYVGGQVQQVGLVITMDGTFESLGASESQTILTVTEATLLDGGLRMRYDESDTADCGDSGIYTQEGTIETTYTLQDNGQVTINSTVNTTGTLGEAAFVTVTTITGTLTLQE